MQLRHVMLDYSATLPKRHFRAGLVDFGWPQYSLPADTYCQYLSKFWLGEFALGQKQGVWIPTAVRV